MKELVEAIRELSQAIRELAAESRRNREMAAQTTIPDPMERLGELIKMIRGGR